MLAGKLCWEPLTSRIPRTGLCSARPLRLHALLPPKRLFAVCGVHFHQATTLCTPAWSSSSCSTGRHHFDLAGRARSIATSSAVDHPRCRVSVSQPPVGSPYASDRLALKRTVHRQHLFVELRHQAAAKSQPGNLLSSSAIHARLNSTAWLLWRPG